MNIITKILKSLLISEAGTFTPKEIEIVPSGTADTKTTITSSQTTDKTLTLPDITDTLVSRTNTEGLSNKTITTSTVDSTPIGQTVPAAVTTTSLVATTADINAGTIDATVIGATTPAAATVTTLAATSGTISGDTITTNTASQTLTNKTLTAPVITNPDIDGGTIDSTPIGQTTPAAGSFTSLTATSGSIGGSNLVTENGTQTLTNKTLTAPVINTGDINNPDIDGGTIDSTVIGATTPAAITGTNVTATGDVLVQGNLTVNGTTVTLNTDTLSVEDKNITINNGGNDAASEGAGLTVDRTGTDGSLIYKDASATKFAVGPVGSEQDIVGVTATQTLTNKTLTSPAVNTPTVSGGSINNTVIGNTTPAAGTFTSMTSTTATVGGASVTTATNSQTLTNKNLDDTTTFIVDTADATKRIAFNAAGTTGTTTTLASAPTTNRTWTLPDATSTAVGTDTTQTLTNKTIQTLLLSSVNDTATGTATTLSTPTASTVRLTSGTLISVAGIPAVTSFVFILENKTGNTISILNEDAGATSANRIQTGTGATVSMTNNSSFLFVYDSTSARYQLVGGTGSGSGSGGTAPNSSREYIANGGAENGTAGWVTYADAAGTRPVDGTGGSPNVTIGTLGANPLHGTASFLFTKDAANRQGQGVSYDFTIDSGDTAKVMKISFDYGIASGTFTAGTSTTDSDLIAYIYDVTNSRLIEPSNIKMFSNSGAVAGRFQAEFQSSSNSVSYRLILHIATTSASAFTFAYDAVSVSPNQYIYGTPVTDSTSYTPTVGAGFGTVTNNSFRYWRVGENLVVRGSFTSGTHAAAMGSISLPTGLSLDSTKLSINNTTAAPGSGIGVWVASNNGAYSGHMVTAPATSTSLVYIGTPTTVAGMNSPLNSVSGSIGAGGGVWDFSFTVPISGWSSSVVVSDNADTRVVAAIVTGDPASATVGNPIIVPTISYDSHGAYNNTTGRYTIFSAGVYKIYGALQSASAATTLSIYKNAVLSSLAGSLDSNGEATFTGAVNCVAGDIIDLRPGATVDATNMSLNFEKVSGPATIAASELVSASYSLASSTAVTANTTVIPFGTVEYDSHGTTISAGVYTALASGTYKVSGHYAANGASVAVLYKNGTAYKAVGGVTASGSGNFTTEIKLIAGDTIHLRSTTSVTITGGALTAASNIAVTRMGL